MVSPERWQTIKDLVAAAGYYDIDYLRDNVLVEVHLRISPAHFPYIARDYFYNLEAAALRLIKRVNRELER